LSGADQYAYAAEPVIACLRAGGVVLLPTDTVYGLAAHPERPDAVAKLFDLKGRPAQRRLPVLTIKRDIPLLGGIVTLEAQKLIASPWMPGPLSLALELTPAAPIWLAGRDEVGFRVPHHVPLQRVLDHTGPLFVTSANKHGAATPETLEAALASLDGTPDLSIDGGTLSAIPSTLVNCHFRPPVIERVGQVPAEEIERYLA
jgi:L-threonylcarbamoyladenylate synthase